VAREMKSGFLASHKHVINVFHIVVSVTEQHTIQYRVHINKHNIAGCTLTKSVTLFITCTVRRLRLLLRRMYYFWRCKSV